MDGSLADSWLSAFILGLVEGATEFLPVSSTGHLIVAAHLLGETSEQAKLFEIVIQLGAILAICWHYRGKLGNMAKHITDVNSPQFALAQNLLIAFLPAAALGLLFHGFIKAHLFSPQTVAVALIVGGIVIILVERSPRPPRIAAVSAMTRRDALWVGCAQSLALFPGVSRAGATIIGGLLRGLDRNTATEFSFLLALPTMFAAVAFDLWKNADLLTADLAWSIAVGFITAFVSALAVVRLLLKFVANHKFTVFGWYRIIFGGLVLYVFW